MKTTNAASRSSTASKSTAKAQTKTFESSGLLNAFLVFIVAVCCFANSLNGELIQDDIRLPISTR